MPINTSNTLDTLTILNIMASYIGIPPLTNLNNITTEPDFLRAQEILNDVTRSVLSQGLPCNTDFEYELNDVDGSGYVQVPAGALICDPIKENYVERSGLIYDLDSKAYVTTTGIKADITWDWTLDDLPTLVQQYISIVASRAFVSRIKGDGEAAQMSIPDERRVKQEFQRYVYNMGDVTILNGEVPYLISQAGRNHFGVNYRF